MNYLFLDTTYHLVIGLFQESKLVEVDESFEKVSSQVLHTKIYNLLKKYNLKVTNLDGIISSSGPGFYTGIRLSQGFTKTSEMMGVPNFNFYHHMLPQSLNINSGYWITQAYKGEIFIYSWGETNKVELIPMKNLTQYLSNINPANIFVHGKEAIKNLTINFQEKNQMLNLIQKNSSLFLQNILNEKLDLNPYYFRPPEDEFKVAGN